MSAADMVLADDNYATIVRAIRGGRAIHDNVVRFLHFLLAGNAGEVLAFTLAILLGLSAPLAVVQILLVNLLLDGLPAVALGFDSPAPDVMRRGPRSPDESFLRPVRSGVPLGRGSDRDLRDVRPRRGAQPATGQSMAFVTLVATRLLFVFAVRGKDWFFHAGRNRALYAAVASSATIALAAMAFRPLADAFDVVSLSPGQVTTSLVLALVPFAVAIVVRSDAGRCSPRSRLPTIRRRCGRCAVEASDARRQQFA